MARTTKRYKATTYMVEVYDDVDNLVEKEYYPKHLFSLKDIFKKLEGREQDYEIYEVRFSKKLNRYKQIPFTETYTWTGERWTTVE